MSVPPRWPGRAAAALLCAWYVATMARDLAFFDSGELALVAAQVGLGHPPGQPVYTLLLALFGRLPSLDPLVGMNLLSALAGGLCALPADALLRRLTAAGAVLRLLALLAIGAVAPLWDQATRIELYAPATLLALCLLAWGLRLVDEGRHDGRGWLGAGALAGVLAGVNPVFALAAAGAVGLCALPSLVRAGGHALARATGAAALGGLALSAAYPLYLLWVRGRTDRLVWGELDTWDGALAYLRGADYAHTEHGAWAAAPGHFAEWTGWLLGQAALPALALGLAGWLALPALRRRLPLFVLPAATGAAFTFTYGVFHPEVPDFNGYLAPAMWLAAVGLAGLLARLPARPALGLAAAVLSVTAFAGERPAWQRSRADLTAPRELAAAWLESMPPHGVLVVSSDHLVFPLMYLQEAEGVRPDVVLVNLGFAASSWYWRHLYQRHPGLPRFDLRAPSSEARLARLLRADLARPARVERFETAVALRQRPCPATWGLALGPACADARDDPSRFAAALAGWWRGGSGRDLIGARVLAGEAQARAEALWALGDASEALAALRAGVPPAVGEHLPVPGGLARPRDALPLRSTAPVLIGDARINLGLGAAALRLLGEDAAAQVWEAAQRE